MSYWRPARIDAMLAAARRHPDAGAFGPLITTPDGVVYPSARHLPSIGGGVGHAVFGWWWPNNPWTRQYRQDAAEPVERTAGWLSGSCLLLRRKAFAEIDGFDPAYFMYFEDVDLGYRLGRAGWTSLYCPSARAVHQGGHSTERAPAAMAAGASPQRLPLPVPPLFRALAGATPVGAELGLAAARTAVQAVREGGVRGESARAARQLTGSSRQAVAPVGSAGPGYARDLGIRINQTGESSRAGWHHSR